RETAHFICLTAMERYPAFRLALSFGMGILIATAVSVPIVFLSLSVAGLALCLWAFIRKNRSEQPGLMLLVIGLGAVSYWLHVNASRCPWEQGRRYVAMIQVASEPQPTETGWRFLAQTRSEMHADGVRSARDFTVLAKLPEDPGWAPRYGDRAWAGGVFALAAGQRNPGGFNYRDYLDHNEVSGILRVEQAQFLSAGHGSWLTAKLIIPARRHVRSVINAYLRGDEAALLSGLALGERNDLSKRVLEAFSNTGTTHVLAVSGLHVVLAAFIIYMLLRMLQLPKRWAGGGTIAGLVFYTLLTGAAPSITRATIMASCGIAGTLFERRGSGLNMLGLAGIVILSFWPQALYDAGFQLSFAATFGILAMTRPIQNVLFRLTDNAMAREWLLLPLAVSAAAQLATAPVIAWHFHRVPIVSLAANLVVVPLTNLLLAIGLCMSLLGVVSLAVIRPLAACAYAVSWLSLQSVELFEAIKFGTIIWPRPDVGQVALYGLSVFLVFRWPIGGKARLALISAAFILLSALIWRTALAGPPGLRVTFLDVGQGDATPARRRPPRRATTPENGRSCPFSAATGSRGWTKCWSATATPTIAAGWRICYRTLVPDG
ncbi:MAG: ComEC/Rec2 family competence protein, partial [Candidatus Edwardsbacteria bacterium]|nr:ComEC/Rec2 family competence protein [Candidatus Edwardsbacteria bacterium]